MLKRIYIICLSIFFVFLRAGVVSAQTDITSPTGKTVQPKEDLPDNIKESLAKQRIEKDKKDYEELLNRCQEAVKLSEELEQSFANSNQLTSEDAKKLERLEKIVKKIRSGLGGEDDEAKADSDDTNTEKSSTMIGVFKKLQSSASQLFDDIKKSTRYSISVFAIQTSNTLLKLVKFLRFGK